MYSIIILLFLQDLVRKSGGKLLQSGSMADKEIRHKFKKINSLIIAVVVAGLVILLMLSRSGQMAKTADSGYREVMGTFAHVVATAKNIRTAQKCVTAGFGQLVYVDEVMSDYSDDSELSRVNRDAFKGAVKVSDGLFEVLSAAVRYSEKSDGAFDVTVGPLVDLWNEAGQKDVKPTSEELAAVKKRIGYEKLILDKDNKTVRFAVDGMRLDLGGIAKGYAIDLAAEAMKENGAIGGMVDVGGDIYCFGRAAGRKRGWIVGLQNPGTTEGDILLKLELCDMAVATSGDYRRFISIQGAKFSHIMNPATSSSAKELVSVSIIAPTAMEADAIATAVSVTGREKGLEMVEQSAAVEAILILAGADPERVLSSGAQKFIKND